MDWCKGFVCIGVVLIVIGLIGYLLHTPMFNNDLEQWWAKQSDRDSLNTPQLVKRQMAPQLQRMFPSHGTCGYCQWPWAMTEAHDIQITESRGGFAVCESCWDHLSVTNGGYNTLRELYQRCRAANWPDFTEEQMNEAFDRHVKLLGVHKHEWYRKECESVKGIGDTHTTQVDKAWIEAWVATQIHD